MKQSQNDRRSRGQKNNGQQGKKHQGKNNNRNRRSQSQTANRQYDSQGPSGKQRGNAKQLYEKYKALANEARGDRQLAESYWQFSDHYYRIYAEFAAAEAAQQAAREAEQQRRRMENAENMGNSTAEGRPDRNPQKQDKQQDKKPKSESAPGDEEQDGPVKKSQAATAEAGLTDGLGKTLGRSRVDPSVTEAAETTSDKLKATEETDSALTSSSAESSTSAPTDVAMPTPRRRGRPRKTPVSVNNEANEDKEAS